ncbi:MAG: tetratricopeptide repeat protein [Methanoregula sp.]
MAESEKWFTEGVALYEKGDYRRAIAAFDKAIAIDPTQAEVWNNRGLCLIQVEHYPEALQSIEKALSLNPGYEHAIKAKKIVLELQKEPGPAGNQSEPADTSPSQVPAAPERKRSKIITVTIVVICIIAASGIIVMKNMQGSAGFSLFPTPTPEVTTIPVVVTAVPTATPVPTPTLPVVPSSGVWVEIIYDHFYSGSVGTPGNMQEVSGGQQSVPNTGDQFYPVPANSGFVTASLHKNDGSGDKLTVKVYKDGTLVKTDSTTTPYGVLYVQAVIPASVATPVAGNNTENVTVPAVAGA